MQIKPADSTQWYKDNGDNTLRIDYPLNQDSIVVDVGSRNGEWADLIKGKYGCQILCFEIVPYFCDVLRNKGYVVFNLGVYDKYSKTLAGSFDGEASLFYKDNTFDVNTIPAKDIFTIVGNHIDLMKINVEGAEYEILENLISGPIDKIKDIQVQFHMVENYQNRYDTIAQKLRKTHNLSWRYLFIWENWTLKS